MAAGRADSSGGASSSLSSTARNAAAAVGEARSLSSKPATSSAAVAGGLAHAEQPGAVLDQGLQGLRQLGDRARLQHEALHPVRDRVLQAPDPIDQDRPAGCQRFPDSQP